MTSSQSWSRPALPVAACCLVILPGILLRLSGAEVSPTLGLIACGGAMVCAAFLLTWAAEAAEMDISGSLAVALLAIIAVLPEYAVDLYLAFRAGTDPSYLHFAAANMTGSNRLLLGLGWPVVVLLATWVASKGVTRTRRAKEMRGVRLPERSRTDLGFLLVAAFVALIVPITGQIHLVLGIALIALFVAYLWHASRGEVREPDLIGTSAAIGRLPVARRRCVVVALLMVAAATVLICAEPFADSLIDTGSRLGLDEFLLVQWLAPLASEAPEFIVAIMFALRGKGPAAIAMLVSAKINQWTALVGSLPVAYLVGGGSASMVLDGRQTEEFLLTAAQTFLGVALLLNLRFSGRAAWFLLGTFALQFALQGTTVRLGLAALYAAMAIVLMIRYRRQLIPTITSPFENL